MHCRWTQLECKKSQICETTTVSTARKRPCFLCLISKIFMFGKWDFHVLKWYEICIHAKHRQILTGNLFDWMQFQGSVELKTSKEAESSKAQKRAKRAFFGGFPALRQFTGFGASSSRSVSSVHWVLQTCRFDLHSLLGLVGLQDSGKTTLLNKVWVHS